MPLCFSVNQDELHALLLALDQQGLEAPADIDIDIDEQYESIVAAAHRVRPCLERASGLPLDLDDHVQDAPFACSIDHFVLINDRTRFGATYYPAFSAKFSLFGDLVALYRSTDGNRVLSGSERRLPHDVFQQARECLVAEGFVPVDGAVLDQMPYDGSHVGLLASTTSWFRRYFSYF